MSLLLFYVLMFRNQCSGGKAYPVWERAAHHLCHWPRWCRQEGCCRHCQELNAYMHTHHYYSIHKPTDLWPESPWHKQTEPYTLHSHTHAFLICLLNHSYTQYQPARVTGHLVQFFQGQHCIWELLPKPQLLKGSQMCGSLGKRDFAWS